MTELKAVLPQVFDKLAAEGEAHQSFNLQDGSVLTFWRPVGAYVQDNRADGPVNVYVSWHATPEAVDPRDLRRNEDIYLPFMIIEGVDQPQVILNGGHVSARGNNTNEIYPKFLEVEAEVTRWLEA